MTKNEEIRARIKAKRFARQLRNESYGWALNVPEDWEKMSDEQIRFALELLPSFGVRRRTDWKWEAVT